MIMGYLLPLFTGLGVLFIPEYDQQYVKWIAIFFATLLLMPFIFSFRFQGNKEKAYRLTLTYQLYTFTFFLTFPIIKVLDGKVFLQIILIGFFLSMHFLARLDQQTEVPIVFPDSDRRKWLAIPFYALPVLLTILGFGGDYVATQRAFNTYGASFMMPYLSSIIYLFSCWLLYFFSSLTYKSHVKEGYLDK